MTSIISFIYSRYYTIISKFLGFHNASVGLSRIYGPIGNKARFFFYYNQLNSVGKNVFFPIGIIFSHKEISIGNNVRFGPNNTIGLVNFGNDIVIAQNVHFLSGKNQHGFDDKSISMIFQSGRLERITIEDDVWIGANSVILSNVSKGTIVGALSLVNKTHETYSIIGGNPAKIIRSR